MRIAAGILMIIGAIIEWMTFMAIMGVIMGITRYLGVDSPYEFLLYVLFIFGAIFVIVGGFYTLKRKSWGLSLTSSILLLPMGTVLPFLMWTDALSSGELITPFAVGITTLFFVLGILPIVFVCLRKREWES